MQQKTYRIGEAGKLLNLKTYVLRFWETEFAQLQPLRTETGQRLYSEEDVTLLKTIRHLLHERGMTIEGARKALAEQPHQVQQFAAQPIPANQEPPSGRPEKPEGDSPVMQGNTILDPAQHLLPVHGMETHVQPNKECPPLANMLSTETTDSSGGPNCPPEGQTHSNACSPALIQDVITELESLRNILKQKN